MKKLKPTKHSMTILHQLCNYIPSKIVKELAHEHGIDKKSRTFTPWSHVVSLLYAQLTHAIGLNDVCDGLRHHDAKLGAIRGAVAPCRNTLSHANKNRNCAMMEALFWKILEHLQSLDQGFGMARVYKGLPRRFKRAIHAIDASTIQLVANCMDWAKHRRRKAAAKLHLRLNLQMFLPSILIVEEASHHDDTRSEVLCAGLKSGEIVVFDKAYVNFNHLHKLTERGVFWVSRAKENMSYQICRQRIKKPEGRILRDDEITLKVANSKRDYPQRFRRIEAEVEVDGKWVVMVFITNNLEWAPSSVCELDAARWAIEVFFKQIKQTLQICDFLGHSKQAIGWQVWSALLLYILLRFQAYLSQWPHSFVRLLTLIRAILWDRFDLREMIDFYGTAHGRWRMRSTPEWAYLPGLEPKFYGTA